MIFWTNVNNWQYSTIEIPGSIQTQDFLFSGETSQRVPTRSLVSIVYTF